MNKLNKVKYECFGFPLRILSHPFAAFDEIKTEKKGSYPVCIGIMAILCFISIFKWSSSSFILSRNNPYETNSLFLIFVTIFPYLIFIAANWFVTTLIEGKGTFGDIFKANMYALYPKIYLDTAGVILSNVLNKDEMMVVQVLFTLATVLYCLYYFISLVTIQDFTFSKGIGALVLIFAAMFIILFVMVLLLTLVGGFIDDIYTIIYEIFLLF